ncbi:two-component regulator propeller domain-containing protein [Reichenbachiella sp.]|uniref:two-component regulator propeller domain-containing protein n=1 Tax=Reichenbachiella sp. TaxID=2184521 RepID=UPI003B5A55FC
MKKLLPLIFVVISCFKATGQHTWIQYNTSNTGENGIVGGYIYCFLNDAVDILWVGSAYGINQFDGGTWNSITSLDGLTVDEVGDISMDSNNNIWISYGSYHAGVSMYNGSDFTHFREQDGLFSDKVNDIMVDQNGHVWFATGFSNNGGISKYDGETWVTYSITEGLPNIGINSIAQDNNGDIWIGTAGAGVYLLQNDEIVPFSWETNSSDNVRDIYIDDSGNIWVAADQNYKYNGSWSTVEISETDNFGLVWDIHGDDKGQIFFSTSKGFTILNGSTFSSFTTGDGIPHNNVFTSFVQNDAVWVGTEGGVARYANEAWTSYSPNDNGLINNDVNSVFEDTNKDLWFCTQGGISKYDDSSWLNYQLTTDGNNIEWVKRGLQDKNGDLWFGTVNGIFKKSNSTWEVFNSEVNGMFAGWIIDVLQDANDNLWFAGFNYLLMYDGTTWTHHAQNSGFQSKYVEALYEDSKGRVWIGSRSGISVYEKQSFQHYMSGEDFVSTASILGFLEDKNGELYAYGGDRILIFKDSSWESFYSGGLINGGTCDNDNQLWFATNNGLLKHNGEWSQYTVENGLSSNIVNSVYYADNGNLYACTNQGITEIIFDITTDVVAFNKNTTIKAYPNPSSGQFTLSLDKRYPDVSINIYNQTGEKVSTEKFSNLQEIGVKLSQPKGLYFLNINTPDKQLGKIKVLKK